MGYKATVLKVMIASPSDVSQERRVARDVVHEWNVIHAEDRHIVLMPVGWETHSYPEMGDRVQAIINKQVLADCDVLVAIFWTRLGSPTGVASSGTVEEIEEHLALGKPALIYFSSAPVRLDSVDNDQYKALSEFKETCRQRGLVEEYDDISAFHNKFTRHLAQTIIRRFAGESDGNYDVAINKPLSPSISPTARELLIEATKDANGIIMWLDAFGGSRLITNNHNFIEHGNSRSIAKWRGAVDELLRTGLVEDRTGKGEVFFVTDQGYSTVDTIDTEIESIRSKEIQPSK